MMIWKLLAKFWSGFKTRALCQAIGAWSPDSMKILFGVLRKEFWQYFSSRNSDGNVPNVNWNEGNRKLHVNWYNPENANGNLRARQKSPMNNTKG